MKSQGLSKRAYLHEGGKFAVGPGGTKVAGVGLGSTALKAYFEGEGRQAAVRKHTDPEWQEKGPTSMDDAKVRLTMAATMQTDPEWQGLRKWTLSTLAVTHGPPATDFAANPAQMSIQLNTCKHSIISKRKCGFL